MKQTVSWSGIPEPLNWVLRLRVSLKVTVKVLAGAAFIAELDRERFCFQAVYVVVHRPVAAAVGGGRSS